MKNALNKLKKYSHILKIIFESMRILILTKRQYMNRDLLNDRYGRFRELPLALAASGHEVTGLCLSYRPRKEGLVEDIDGEALVTWHALNAKRLLPLGSTSYWRILDNIEKDFRPDLVWACSDAIHAILGVRVASRLGAPLVIDLYDNFESYWMTRLPGVTSMFRRALRRADGITCVSKPLSHYVRETMSYKGPIEVIENAVPKGLFQHMDKAVCRNQLGLPVDALIIGTAGSISRSRGIETLFQAFEKVSGDHPDVYLALAGPCDKGLAIPENPRVLYLGNLSPKEVPAFLCSLDIAVVCNKESAFGKYCFPQKFYESVACGIPTVAAGTGSMQELLKDKPEYLYEPENVDSLVGVLGNLINNPSKLDIEVPTWNDLGKRLEVFFKSIL